MMHTPAAALWPRDSHAPCEYCLAPPAAPCYKSCRLSVPLQPSGQHPREEVCRSCGYVYARHTLGDVRACRSFVGTGQNLMGNATALPDPNPWNPLVNDARDLKTLGKLAEELGECGAAVARCIIQGVEACEPVTGKPNRQWLEEELADVLANLRLVENRFKLDQDAIEQRAVRKMAQLMKWHDQL